MDRQTDRQMEQITISPIVFFSFKKHEDNEEFCHLKINEYVYLCGNRGAAYVAYVIPSSEQELMLETTAAPPFPRW